MQDSGSRKTKIITVTSLKGGVGKSTVTANLGYSLALRGKQTLVIDCDFNIRNLDLIMGLEDRVVYDFGDAVRGGVKAEKAVIRDPRSEYLSMCAAPYTDFQIPSEQAFSAVIDELSSSGRYDFIVIDTPGDSGTVMKLAVGCSDVAIIVTTHNPASLRAAERTGALVQSFGARESFLVINNFSYSETKLGYFPGILSVIDRAGIGLLGIIPDDETIQRYQEDGILVAQTGLVECKAAFTNIAARICGEDVPLFAGFPKKAARKYLAAL